MKLIMVISEKKGVSTPNSSRLVVNCISRYSGKYAPPGIWRHPKIEGTNTKLDTLEFLECRIHLKGFEPIKKTSFDWIEFREISNEISNDTIQNPLIYIYDLIDDALELLEYPSNWDDEGAESTDPLTLGFATFFLKEYAEHLNSKYEAYLIEPSINIMKNGSIYLHWETPDAKMLIIFTKGESDVAYFYGEGMGQSTMIPFKGGIEIMGKVQEYIAQWMLNYLVKK